MLQLIPQYNCVFSGSSAGQMDKWMYSHSFHPALQLMPLKLHPVTFVFRSCSSIAYEHSISHCLSAIRSVDIKLFGAPARLHFRGTATLLIKAPRRVQALSPSASWYCLLKPKEPNNNKHLCCYRLSLSLISCRGDIFRVNPFPLPPRIYSIYQCCSAHVLEYLNKSN